LTGRVTVKAIHADSLARAFDGAKPVTVLQLVDVQRTFLRATPQLGPCGAALNEYKKVSESDRRLATD